EEIHSREELQQTLRLIVKNQILRSA
ncbi:MAG: thioredoxin, partial [Microcystis aeruginosa]